MAAAFSSGSLCASRLEMAAAFFNFRQILDHDRVDRRSSDGEIPFCPQGLYPVVGVGGDFKGTNGICFNSCFHNNLLLSARIELCILSETILALLFDTGRITPGQKFVNTAAEELWNFIYFCI